MNKIKTLLGTIVCGAIVATACLPLAACEGLTPATHVSTFEQWKNLESASKIVLDADIDCGGETVTYLCGTQVDGNGHTVSNLIVSVVGQNSIGNIGLFHASSVKNITLDSITMIAEPRMTNSNFSVGFVCGQTVRTKDNDYQLMIENVHVKNSSMKVTQNTTDQNHRIGAIAGSMSCYSNTVNAKLGESYIRNCTVDNVTIEVDSKESQNKSSLIVGGLIGTANGEISDCAVTNSTISAKGNSYMSTVYVGGIVGTINGEASVTHSFAQNNTITAKALWHDGGFLGLYSTATVYVGGAFASASAGPSVTACYAAENEIGAYSSGTQYTGGFAGATAATLSQCYSSDSNLTIGGRYESDQSAMTVPLGGFCGYAGAAPITSCFTVNNDFMLQVDKYNSADGKTKEIREGGFAGTAKDARFSACAAYTPTVGWLREWEYTWDAFCCTELEDKLVSNCYYDGISSVNVNECAAMTEDDWFDPSTVKANLRLNDLKWVFESGKFPVLGLA